MKINIKDIFKNKITLFAGLTLCLGGSVTAYFLLSGQNEPMTGLRFTNLEQNTIVKYKITEGQKILLEGEKQAAAGNVALPLPENAKNSETIKYSMRLLQESGLESSMPETAIGTPENALDLIVNLKTDRTGAKKLEFAASGLNEFSEIKVKKGENSEKLSADWSGLFEGELTSKLPQNLSGQANIPNIDEHMEVAFQKFGIHSDSDIGTGPKMEVFLFGGGGGASIGDVRSRYTRALFQMAEELSAVMMMQTFIVGTFFDASIQLDTQRKLQELMARAHKDYHPSEQMCRIGTFVRSLSASEGHGEIVKRTFNRMLMNSYLGKSNSSAAAGTDVDDANRVRNYIENYCDPSDNGQSAFGVCPATGGTAANLERRNKDIDYYRTFAEKLTLDVDVIEDNGILSNEEEDLFALSRNLYFPSVFPRIEGQIEDKVSDHYKSRSFAAKMNVAHSSFVSILGMKAATAPRQSDETGAAVTSAAQRQTLEAGAGWNFMKSLMREFGTFTDDQIHEMLGDRPSYYAQMEVLTKKIYQHPNFYTNLYDKPANVDRIGASLDAIALMHQRDRYESMLRREMLSAMLVEEALNAGPTERVKSDIYEATQRSQYEE